MKSYPYIGGIDSDCKTLFLDECYGIAMEHSELEITGIPEYDWSEDEFTNITHEYLQNTYGEVVSPEYAEFIIELAKNAGFGVSGLTARSMCFEFSGDCNVVFYEIPVDIFANNEESKQITIPLPPKAEPKIYPQENLGETHKHFDCVCNKCGGKCCTGQCDKQELSEWPQVGDGVLVCSDRERIIEIKDKQVKVIGKCTHSDGSTILTVEHASLGVFAVAEGSWIKKPKTPEEELRDEIVDIIDNASCSEQAAEYIVETYGIKKPQ